MEIAIVAIVALVAVVALAAVAMRAPSPVPVVQEGTPCEDRRLAYARRFGRAPDHLNHSIGR